LVAGGFEPPTFAADLDAELMGSTLLDRGHRTFPGGTVAIPVSVPNCPKNSLEGRSKRRARKSKLFIFIGAGEGNRTLVRSLGSGHLAIDSKGFLQ
jgi:hypothetical protein